MTNDPDPSFTYSGHPPGDTDHFECHLVGEGGFDVCPPAGKDYTGLGEGPHTFEVRAVDAGSHADPTPASRSFTVDTTAPDPPQITGSDPDGPANNNHPKLKGTAEDGSQVKLYEADCAGAPVAQGTAGEFASPGLSASVPNNSTTAFRATATDPAGNTSGCSDPFSYKEVTPTTTRPGEPPTAGPGAASLADGSVKAKKSIPLAIACAAGEDCDGAAEVNTAGPVSLSRAAASKRKKKIVLLGQATFSIPAGKLATVHAPLTRKGRRLLRRKHRLTAEVGFTTYGGGKSATTSGSLSIKLKRKRH